MELTEKYLKETIRFCSQFVRPRKSERRIVRVIQRVRQILGSVPGRARTEDVRLGIDKALEDMFIQLLQDYRKKHGLRVRVFSEHGTYGDPDPQYLCAIDPFDGSGIFRRGLVKEWYSVLTFFDLAGKPLCGGSSDILQKELYFATPEGVLRVPFERGVPTKVSASRKRTLDANTLIAAYLMNRDYRREWEEKTRRLGDKFPGLLVWPNGGACIYHLIASGEVPIYIMFNEPRSEIDPGLAFAKCSPFPVVSVAEDGTFKHYSFEAGKQDERVPFLVAACTEELVKNIVSVIMTL